MSLTTSPSCTEVRGQRRIGGPRRYRRLFARTEHAAGEGREPASHKELRRFKQMHFYAHRMKRLVDRYGAAAVNRPGYQWFSELHRKMRNEITSDNLGLVYRACKRHHLASVHDDDLLSEGMMALDRAISSFDPWRGLCFSTYACTAITRGLSRYRMKEAKRVRWLSEHINREADRSSWAETRRTEASRAVRRASRPARERGASRVEQGRTGRARATVPGRSHRQAPDLRGHRPHGQPEQGASQADPPDCPWEAATKPCKRTPF